LKAMGIIFFICAFFNVPTMSLYFSEEPITITKEFFSPAKLIEKTSLGNI